MIIMITVMMIIVIIIITAMLLLLLLPCCALQSKSRTPSGLEKSERYANFPYNTLCKLFWLDCVLDSSTCV